MNSVTPLSTDPKPLSFLWKVEEGLGVRITHSTTDIGLLEKAPNEFHKYLPYKGEVNHKEYCQKSNVNFESHLLSVTRLS